MLYFPGMWMNFFFFFLNHLTVQVSVHVTELFQKYHERLSRCYISCELVIFVFYIQAHRRFLDTMYSDHC